MTDFTTEEAVDDAGKVRCDKRQVFPVVATREVATLKTALKEQDEQIKELKKEARRAHSLPDKLGLQKKIRDLQKKRDEAWREYDQASREIEEQKDELIDRVEKQLKRSTFSKELFTVAWRLM